MAKYGMQGCAAKGSLSKEDAAFICVEALENAPQNGLLFEVGTSATQLNYSLSLSLSLKSFFFFLILLILSGG